MEAIFASGVGTNELSFTYDYTYTPAGKVASKSLMVQSANHLGGSVQASGTLTASYGYDGQGALVSQQYPISETWASGTSNTFTYTLDALERPTQMTDSSSKTWASGATYNAANQPLYDGTATRTYNNLLQMTSIVASGLNMTYNYSATKNNGQITSSVDGISGETVTYAYDALRRLSNASSSASWSAGYTFDGYGNLLGIAGSGGPPSISLTAVVNANNVPTNQIQATGVTYDNNGNQTAGFGGLTFSYDAANRMVGVGGSAAEAYAYDSSNLRVYGRNASGAETIYFYGVDGKKLATYTYAIITYSGSPEIQLAQQSANVYFLGKLISAEGNAVQVDRLGSVRSGGPGGLGHQAEYPYGAEYTQTANDREKYATYTRDSVTGLDYAMNRYYASTWGRFTSPDPSGNSIDPASPQSWNRYPYVGGDPVNSNDGTGLGSINSPCGPNGVWSGEGCYTFGGWVGGQDLTNGYNLYVGGVAQSYANSGTDIGLAAAGVIASQSGSVTVTSTTTTLTTQTSSTILGSGVTETGPPQTSSTTTVTVTVSSPVDTNPSPTAPSAPLAPSQPQAPSGGGGQIGTPRTPSQCSSYQDGSAAGNLLSTICQGFPNNPVSNQIRGCLQSLYSPGSGYIPIPIIIIPSTVLGPGGADLDSLLPGTGAHLLCFANAAGLP